MDKNKDSLALDAYAKLKSLKTLDSFIDTPLIPAKHKTNLKQQISKIIYDIHTNLEDYKTKRNKNVKHDVELFSDYDDTTEKLEKAIYDDYNNLSNVVASITKPQSDVIVIEQPVIQHYTPRPTRIVRQNNAGQLPPPVPPPLPSAPPPLPQQQPPLPPSMPHNIPPLPLVPPASLASGAPPPPLPPVPLASGSPPPPPGASAAGASAAGASAAGLAAAASTAASAAPLPSGSSVPLVPGVPAGSAPPPPAVTGVIPVAPGIPAPPAPPGAPPAPPGAPPAPPGAPPAPPGAPPADSARSALLSAIRDRKQLKKIPSDTSEQQKPITLFGIDIRTLKQRMQSLSSAHRNTSISSISSISSTVPNEIRDYLTNYVQNAMGNLTEDDVKKEDRITVTNQIIFSVNKVILNISKDFTKANSSLSTDELKTALAVQFNIDTVKKRITDVVDAEVTKIKTATKDNTAAQMLRQRRTAQHDSDSETEWEGGSESNYTTKLLSCVLWFIIILIIIYLVYLICREIVYIFVPCNTNL